jgi:2,3-bisphosphoglycerate-independent phosphoglycerate mutase
MASLSETQPRRCILVILDGLGDHGHAVFGGQTPLQAASTPNLDRLATLGMNGLYHSYLQGVAMPSEIAHFLMFGYNLDDFPGRGYLEAVGENISLAPKDVALLGRIFSVREDQQHLILEVEDPEVDVKTCLALQQDIKQYAAAGVEVEFVPTKGIQGLVIIRGEVSPDITDSNPIHEGRPLMQILPIQGKEQDERVGRTCQALNEYLLWSFRRLSRHPLNQARLSRGLPPLNAVGLQRAGQHRPVPAFEAKWGLRPLAIATGPLYRGLSQYLGMPVRPVRDTKYPEADLRDRLQMAKELPGYDFVYVHTKAPDVAAHTKDPRIKKRVIEILDRAFVYALNEIVTDPNILLVITADHSTNSAGRMIHSGESVPLTMIGAYTRRDAVTRFDEISNASGSLNLVRGPELMHLILNFLDRGKLFGLMDSPVDQPFSPGPATPLIVD